MSKKLNSVWEVKKLEEVCLEIFQGTKVPKDGTGNYPAIKSGDITKQESLFVDRTTSFVNSSSGSKNKSCQEGDILVIRKSMSKKLVGKIYLYRGKELCIIDSNMYGIKHNLDPYYLLYFLNSLKVQNYIQDTLQKFSCWSCSEKIIYKDSLLKIKIPLPSLNVQKLIGNYLYRLSLLEEQLKSSWRAVEEQKLKQFHYYSETLLIKKNKAEIVELGSIATEIYSGSEVTKAQLGTGDYPAIKNKDISSFGLRFKECFSFIDLSLIKNPKYVEKEDLIMSNMGALKIVGKTSVYLGNQKCLVGNHVVVLKHNQNGFYLSFLLSSGFCRKQIEKLAQKSTVCDLYIPSIKKIQIPLPSLEEQQQIVDKLDVFYECLENIKLKVPQLISLQKQSFQYYINKFTSC